MAKNVEINNSYYLPEDNFIKIESDKTKILIGDTFNSDMNHYKEWLIFNNGKFKKTCHYTISKDGKIYNHVDTKFSTNFLDIEKSENYIFILIENLGWLEKNGELYKNCGDTIYEGVVYEQKWRNKKYWDPYTSEQLSSTIDLVNLLSANYNIDKEVRNDSFLSNNKNDKIFYKSNLSRIYKDINPSWEFSKFKKGIE